MPHNPFGHVDIRVPDLEAATRFYGRLLPALGFTRQRHDPEWKVWAAEGALPSAPWVAITGEADHRPNSTRIAFWVASLAEVDRLAAHATAAGARNVSGPRACPEYSPSYYAVFFEDPSGNRFEICYRTD